MQTLEELQRERAAQRAAEAAEPTFNPAQPIINERAIMKTLNEEGWIGHASQLRALAFHGEDLRQRYENECSHAWAGNSDTYKAGTTRLEAHIAKLAREAGLALYIQGDCRGVAVYVRAKGQEIDDNRYSTQGASLALRKGRIMQTQSEFDAMCENVYKCASRASMAVLIVPGAVADDLGSQGLQIVCNRAGRNLITDRTNGLRR
jgi:hypothetical protein